MPVSDLICRQELILFKSQIVFEDKVTVLIPRLFKLFSLELKEGLFVKIIYF